LLPTPSPPGAAGSGAKWLFAGEGVSSGGLMSSRRPRRVGAGAGERPRGNEKKKKTAFGPQGPVRGMIRQEIGAEAGGRGVGREGAPWPRDVFRGGLDYSPMVSGRCFCFVFKDGGFNIRAFAGPRGLPCGEGAGARHSFQYFGGLRLYRGRTGAILKPEGGTGRPGFSKTARKGGPRIGKVEKKKKQNTARFAGVGACAYRIYGGAGGRGGIGRRPGWGWPRGARMAPGGSGDAHPTNDSGGGGGPDPPAAPGQVELPPPG